MMSANRDGIPSVPVAMEPIQNTGPQGPTDNAPGVPARTGWDKKRLAVVAAALIVLAIGGAVFAIVLQFSSSHEYRAARQSLEKRDFEAASRQLREHLKNRPTDFEVVLLAAQTARRQGEFADALDFLAACAKQNADHADLKLERQLLHVQKGDLREVDSLLDFCAKHPEARQTSLILEAVIAGSINRLLATFTQEKSGQAEMSVADHQRALHAVDQWLTICSSQDDQVQGALWRGKLFSLARDYPQSRAEFRKAVNLDPNHVEARELLGSTLALVDPREAVTHLQFVHEHVPSNTKVSFLLATAYRAGGQLDQAAQILDGLLASQPKNVSYLVERGHVALEQRRPNEAEPWLQRAVLLSPTYAEANRILSQCLLQLDQPEKSQQYYARFLQLEDEMKRQREASKKKS